MDRHCQCHPGLPRPLAVERGFERLWRPVRCQIHCPSSVVSGRPRREPSQRHGGQSGASSVQHCGSQDPLSGKRPCAGAILSCLQIPCCTLGISDAACSRAATEHRLPPSRTQSFALPGIPGRRGLNSESQSRHRFRTGSWPCRTTHACLQACVARVGVGWVRTLSRRFYFDCPFEYPLPVCRSLPSSLKR